MKKELTDELIKSELLAECAKTSRFIAVFSVILFAIAVAVLIIYKWQTWISFLLILCILSSVCFIALNRNEKKYKEKINNEEFTVTEYTCLKKTEEPGDNEKYRYDYYLDFGLEAEVEVGKSLYAETSEGDEFYIVFVAGDPDPRLLYNKNSWIRK